MSNNWMSSDTLNERFLYDLGIPGTHDSGSLGVTGVFQEEARCQSIGIAAQLELGIRFLDLRIRLVGDDLWIYHGSYDCHLSFKDALADIYAFLSNKDNSKECVIVSIKDENPQGGKYYSTSNFINTAMQEMRDSKIKWYTENTVPKLKDVRGFAVLLRRWAPKDDPNYHYGLNAGPKLWKDNYAYFEINTPHVNMAVQDEYDSGLNFTYDACVSDKYTYIYRAYQNFSRTSNTLCLNFTSLSFETVFNGGLSFIASPKDFALGYGDNPGINGQLSSLLSETSPISSITIMDFVDEAIVNQVIQQMNPH